jgi:hypothetical protein
MRVTVDLQEGFDKDRVVLRIAAQTVFDEPAVSTRRQLGLARTIALDGAPGATLIVELPDKGLSERIELGSADPIFIGVNLERDGRLSHRISGEAFGYV